MAIVTRFAPSPTGQLHLGHAYSATRAHDFARERGGSFLLRIEDIDGTRSRPEHVATILDDLRWLGLDWDGEVVFQSQRLDRYEAALDRLRAMGLLYPCFCTRAEIAREVAASLSAPQGPDGPRYPGTCRGAAWDTQKLAETPHSWRIDMGKAVAMAGSPEWRDGGVTPTDNPAVIASGREAIQGEARGAGSLRRASGPARDDGAVVVRADPAMHGDVVLARKDAPASYHLAVTIDDAEQGVTDVVRGRDLFAATHVHRLLQALLDLPVPRWHHHALLTGPDGHRLAKRDGAPALAAMRAEGVDGHALADTLRTGALPVGIGRANA